MEIPKMKIEIWSDIACPFCYIAKRNFEEALMDFPEIDQLDIEWKSYQLNPDYQPVPGMDTYTELANRKGKSIEWAIEFCQNITDMATEVGLDYRFEILKQANTFNTHRLIQLAKTKGLDDEIEEALFQAHFTDGKDLNQWEVLKEIGLETGLEDMDIQALIDNEELFAEEIRKDVYEAYQLGINSVPFFVMDNKYGVKGAQPVGLFIDTIEKSFKEWSDIQV